MNTIKGLDEAIARVQRNIVEQVDVSHSTIVLAALTQAKEQGTWRCFHCDEVFSESDKAEEHFGSLYQDAACTIDITKYREMEALVAKYCAEDTDLHREIHRISAQAHTDVQRAEEKGYARGLADAQKYPETLGLAPIAQEEETSGHLASASNGPTAESLEAPTSERKE